MTMQPLTVIVLTYNEALNIQQCLRSVVGWASEVIVLDSHSKDQTVTLAEGAGAQIFHRRFDNYANQRTYAIRELSIRNRWILFLDADEYLSDPIKAEIGGILQHPDTACAGYFIRLHFYFLGKRIRFGGYNACWKLVLFQRDHFRGVERPIDEHVVLEGRIGYARQAIIHNDRKSVRHWFDKHIQYANLHAQELIDAPRSPLKPADLIAHGRERKRWIKERIWPHIPLFIRASLYFFYRYGLRLGFLDGKAGFLFHFNQAFLYHFIIGTLHYEKRRTGKATTSRSGLDQSSLHPL